MFDYGTNNTSVDCKTMIVTITGYCSLMMYFLLNLRIEMNVHECKLSNTNVVHSMYYMYMYMYNVHVVINNTAWWIHCWSNNGNMDG